MFATPILPAASKLRNNHVANDYDFIFASSTISDFARPIITIQFQIIIVDLTFEDIIVVKSDI